MPFKSDKQRKFLYAKYPELAKKWSNEKKAEAEKNQPKQSKKK